ncbi:MAG: glycoside hydrolase family 28 protein [Candidatus Moraniibacteriota bacterium]
MRPTIPNRATVRTFTLSLSVFLPLVSVLSLGIGTVSDAPQPTYETVSIDPFENTDDITPPFSMPAIVQPVFPDRTCDITDYGAVPDATTKNTKPIADAIADCSNQGGGHVVIPKGTWLTGAIHLEDGIDLHLDPGAIVSFSTDPNDYLPVVLSRYEGVDVYNYSPLVYAYGKHNIAITGTGRLVGNGNTWKGLGSLVVTHALYAMGDQSVPIPDRIFGSQERMLRPAFVEFVHCGSILFQDFTIESGPMWTIHPTYSHDIVVRNVSVLTDGQNNDGLDIDSSRNVLVERSSFDTHDDAIALKSGKARDGLTENIPTENIIIRNTTIKNGHAGIAVGSEIAGGVRNVFAYGLTMRGSQYGVRLKALETERVNANSLWFRDIRMDKVLFSAIQMTMHYGPDQAEGDPTGVPSFSDIHFSNIVSPHARESSIDLDALEESPIGNVTIENSTIGSGSGMSLQNVDGVTMTSVAIRSTDTLPYTIVNGRNVSIDSLTCPALFRICASISGSTTEHISLTATNPVALKKKILIDADVPADQVSY